ncbi:membrane-associated protein, putative [Bodo saltans]|uniref:Membrane-associated protein, putative n=1 Tax=Bodo saltans TaxID=75058 RepID=A0A0S4J4F2_BODSA|nr:membrane-associated protein, putative [Bodo saltans]|eukprot:CUG79676.1 membrane-associated protein, putative [Bodo saltans]
MVVARSAIVSNLCLVVTAMCCLVGVAAAWSCVLDRGTTTIRESMLMLSMPSSLLPVWIAVVSSSTSAAVLLLGRVHLSPCVGGDVVLAVVFGVGVAIAPAAALLYLWMATPHHWQPIDVSGTATSIKKNTSRKSVALRFAANTRLQSVLRRRWKWRSSERTTMQSAWVVLLEYRCLWYPCLDASLLMCDAMLSIVGGLDSTDVHLCRGSTAAVVALLGMQAIVVVVSRPFTTLFSTVHAVSTLTCTCLSTFAQLLFLVLSSSTDGSSMWLLTASAACNLIVVGISALKMILDLFELVAAMGRRLQDSKNGRVHSTAHQLATVQESQNDVGFLEQLLVEPLTSTETLSAEELDDSVTHFEVIQSAFWDKAGNAKTSMSGDGLLLDYDDGARGHRKPAE